MLGSNILRRAPLFIIVVSILLAVPFIIEDSDGESKELIRIYEVNPYGNEGFSLYNYGSTDFDLRGIKVTDGEATITFTSSLVIKKDSRLTVTIRTENQEWFSSRENVHAVGADGIVKTGNFALNNSGDDITLISGSTTIDAVCYGNRSITTGWSGDPVPMSSNCYILRTGIIDTDTSEDWIKTKAGYTNISFDPNDPFECEIMPFTFPESDGGPIYDALEGANKEVLISIYQLTSKNLVALLIDLEERTGDQHVDVKIILEGDPLNYDISTELSLMCSIVNSGGEVWLINTAEAGNYERYSFFHNKYAIIDNETTIITSENWTISNMSDSNSANRGWGAMIKSSEYADFMKVVWENDHDTAFGDVAQLMQRYPNLKQYSGSLEYAPFSTSYEGTWYDAQLVPVLSPDHSYQALNELIGEATECIYSEQLDLGSSYSLLEDDSPVYWMSAASNNGIDCKFILDGSISDVSSVVNLINTTTDVKACYINGGEGFGTTHNKGILIDKNITWIGSVNWTENSFLNNRETAIIVYSEDVNRFFLEYFMEDWNNNNTVDIEDLRITVKKGISEYDDLYLFTVEGPDSVTYLWSLDEGDKITTKTPQLLLQGLTAGEHRINVTIEDTNYGANYSFTVEKISQDDNSGLNSLFSEEKDLLACISAIAITTIGTIIAISRKKG